MPYQRSSCYSPLRLAWLALATAAALALAMVLMAALGRAQVAQAQPAQADIVPARPANPAAPAATIAVTNTGDTGPGTLRRAINTANVLSAGPDVIVFDLAGCPCVITLLAALPVITQPLAINGPGAHLLAIDGGSNFRVIETDTAPVILAGLTIQNGSVAGQGGGILSDGPLTLTHVHVLSNTATGQGGGLYAGGDTTVVGGVFRANASTGNDAGGAYVGDTMRLSGTTFISNTAEVYGGALYGDTAIIIGGWLEDNYADGEGGAIYLSELVMTDTMVLSNTANSYGGGAYASETHISGGQFVGNVSGSDAGALGSGSPLIISGTAFIRNRTNGHGAAIYGEGDASVHGAYFEGNRASDDGGAIHTYAPLTVTASTFVDNLADRGGAIYLTDNGSFENVLFAGNVATSTGSAMYFSNPADTVHLAHLTVVGPAAPAPAALVVDSGAMHVTNTIVSNYAVGIAQQSSGTASEDYNLFYNVITPTTGVVTSSNRFTGDPDFADPGAGNYRLGPNSAALDEGADDVGVATDFDGEARPQGAGFDIGYDEASFVLGLALNYVPAPAWAGEPVNFTATITGGLGVSYTWDFGDGSPLAAGNPVAHTYASPSVYTVTVTAANTSGSAQVTTQVNVHGRVYLPLIMR